MIKKGLVLICTILCLALAYPALAEGGVVALPSSLTQVEASAFEGDNAMNMLVIPASVGEIGSRAFADCKSLTTVRFEGENTVIAADAFEGSPVAFLAKQGSAAETYALAHGITVTLLEGSGSFTDSALNLVLDRGKPESGLMGEALASERLLVQMNGSSLPDISEYEPVRILSEGTGFFVVQFDSINQASACYDFLKEQEGQSVQFVEPDAFVTVNYSSDGEVSAASLNENWSDPDPMGLADYSAYIQENYPDASATVAVIDSGVAYHSALNDHILPGYDFTGQGNPRYDANNHGTSVAGTIIDAVYGANVKIIPIRVFGGAFQTTLMIRQAVQQAINCHPSVINISSVFDESAAVRSLLERAGCPVVVSAGNENANCDNLFPAGLSSVITVSSIDTNKTKAAHSNYGSSVDFCAPGTNISGYTSTGGVYNDFAGTSYAAPQISAAIALLSMDPERGLKDLQDGCMDLGSPGWDQYYGYGLPDLSLRVHYINITNEADIPAVMEVGGTCVLMYEIGPDSARDKTVTVASSASSVLNVTKTADGVLRVVGLSSGTAHVTITANDGSGVSASSKDITVVVPVTQITIDAPTNIINVAKEGETLGLGVTVLPTNATDKEVIWSSADETIATVAQNGVVTPRAEGKTTIRAVAKDGFGAYGEFEVGVVNLIVPIKIDIVKPSPVVIVDADMQLSIMADPDNAVKSVTWYSTNKDIAAVSSSGKVTGKAPGRVYIVATSTLDQTVQASCELIISQPPLSVEMTAEEGATGIVDVGTSLQLNAWVLPENADDTRVVWESSNDSVATVDQTGRVYGVASGEAVIKAYANGDPTLEKTYPVTVRLLPNQVTIQGDDYVYPDTTKQLTAVVLPANADDTSVTWTSKNPEIATVTNTGAVRGIAEGVAVIEVKCNAVPELTATITVNVYPEWSYFDWVTADLLPDNGIVTDRKWTYTETTTTTTANLSGWTLAKEEWKQTGSGSQDYCPTGNYPSTYDKNHWTYTSVAHSPVSGYDNGTTKRVVASPVHGGYIYWHWMYNVTYAAGTTRTISDRSGNWNANGSSGGNGYYYFYAMKSTVTCPYLDNYYCCSRNQPSYNCHNIIPSNADKSNTSGLGTDRFFRIEYLTSNYTDYTKYYTYTREMTVTSEPEASSSISNVKAYVKYKVANTNGMQLSGWVPEANVPQGAEVVEARWTYKETVSNNSASMDGWTLENSVWQQSGTGSVRWADFAPISGFDTGNSLYTTFHKTVPTAYENATAKRVINSTVNDGYIYWHWMYSVSSNAYDRAIFYKYGTGSSTLTGNNYVYKFFGAFESRNTYPQMDAGTNWGQNDTYYLWYKVTDRTSNADTQGSWYWYRTQIHKTSYTDYTKLFTYSRNVTTTTEPTPSSTISDITKLVRYIVKK